MYREVKQEKSKIALLASLDRMTGLSIPREIKEKIISESYLDIDIDWKRTMQPCEVGECLKATQQIVQGILTPDEYDYESPDPDVEGIHSFRDLLDSRRGLIVHLYDLLYDSFKPHAITGCLKGICFQTRDFVDYEEYARLFHPHLFRRLQNIDGNDDDDDDNDDDDDDEFSDERREAILDEIQQEYERDDWGMTSEFDDEWILNLMSGDIFGKILARLGYDRDINLDSAAGLTKWRFLNGFTSFLFESWIPEMLLSAFQEREENYQRLKKALEDIYGADIVVPDLESILRNKQEWPLSYEYVAGTLRLEDLVDIKRHCASNSEEGTVGKRLLDLQSACRLECGLGPPSTSKILGMLTDPASLAKFPSIQTYLETEDIDRVVHLVRGVRKCLSMGISEVDLSYAMHPQVSALFDMSSQRGRRRRNCVRNLVATIFNRLSNRSRNKKRCRLDDEALITLKYKRNMDGVKIYNCPRCSYSCGGPKMILHISRRHPSFLLPQS